MKYTFSRHALEQLGRRGIPREMVERTIGAPGQVVPEFGGTVALQSQVEINGKLFLLRVIVAFSGESGIVVPVYRISKINKYWKVT